MQKAKFHPNVVIKGQKYICHYHAKQTTGCKFYHRYARFFTDAQAAISYWIIVKVLPPMVWVVEKLWLYF